MTLSTLRPPRRRRRWVALFISPAACLLCVACGLLVYQVPFVRERLEWRLLNLRAQIWYRIFPPEEEIFVPDPTAAAQLQSTLLAASPTPTPAPTAGPTGTPTVTPTPTIAPTPLPESVQLDGVRHEYQQWNNCGPANLSMALSFWGWQGDQRTPAAYMKPNPRDKNVMPYEMEDFVETQTGLRMVVRYGGDLDMLRRLIAGGFPVIVEKGFEGAGFDGWMGHYEVLTGYDDAARTFTAQDSYIIPDLPVPYDQLAEYWRHFNYVYLVVYPPDREAELLALLGPDADPTFSIQRAAQRASDEVFTLTGRDRYFAWFNRGSSLVLLQDYQGAAAAYDEAFALYPTIEAAQRPWRLLWYQTGPYFAYYYSGRYLDVIDLATRTLGAMEEPILEESYYWRALSLEVLGDVAGAIEDLEACLRYHVGFGPCQDALARVAG